MEPHEQHDELKKAPFLRSLPKVDPFVVPEGFFEGFPHAVGSRILKQRSKRAGWSAFILRPSVVGAFAVFAVVLLAWFAWPVQEHLESLSEQVIEPEELPQGTWDTDFLYEELGEEGFATTMDLPMDDEVLFAYLINEDLSLDLLTDEL
jgi:hypothetical protein